MPTKKYKQKLMKHQICVVARAIACVAFLVLTIIGVSSLVRAMSLDTVENQNGIPSAWKVASLGQPETITVPITYWDQRQDDCDDPNRQFEWVQCGYWTSGTIHGVVKNQLGSDGTPIPSFTNNVDAWAANRDVFTANVTGHDPLLPTDNFYRWFHDTDKSKSYEQEITFNRVGDTNTYSYDSGGFFPLDNVDFSKNDEATKEGHNYHFTAHLSVAMKVAADGTERFEFSGDDDVWVFLNGQLVLDLGGLHEILTGHFTINKDGSITTYTQGVNDPSVRDQLGTPSNSYNGYVNPLNQLNRKTAKDETTTINAGLKAGDVVTLDFFYAERSTTASNNKITISNMNWPISADSTVQGEIIGKVQNTESNLVEYTTSIKNRDPNLPLELDRISTYIKDTATITHADGSTEEYKNAGFLPHSVKTLSYTTTPEVEKSWQPVEIAPPSNTESGFALETPLMMSPSGQEGDTLYFHFLAETSEHVGTIVNRTSYYTQLNGISGVTYDDITLDYVGHRPAVKYDLTVNYEIDWQDEEPDESIHAPATYTEKIEDGQSYAVTSPTLEGFTPDQSVVSGTINGDNVETTVYYQRQNEVKPTHTVRIRFLHSETNAELLPEHTSIHEAGDTFTYYPKDVDGYTKDTEKLDITVNEDTDLIVYYTPKPVTPETPATPITPVDPEQPKDPTEELPTIPVIPGDDDDLLFLAPLGEVAFVPNTGVISDYVAPIFEQYFASVILSQGFILVVLLIFSGSFAVYFSLRKYLDLSVAPRTVMSTKKMPKKIANSKTARKMQKTAKKSSRTATKTTRKSSVKRKK